MPRDDPARGVGGGDSRGAVPAQVPLVGNRLGPYRVLSSLGSGGMGTVYMAVMERPAVGLQPGTFVALKVIHAHLRSLEALHVRFRREAEIGRQIIHPNVVRTYGTEQIEQDGTTIDVIVMEYVEGQTLRSFVKETARVPEELCRHVGHEAAKGLAAIHDAGVVHRDVKPENILVTKDEVVKVMDLGAARIGDNAMRLTQTGAFIGTTFYAAPEQFRSADESVDPRADLFSLGLTLYELSTGVHPFADADLYTYLNRLLSETPRPPSEVNPQLSPFFEEVVRTLMERERDRRFSSAAELALILAEGESSDWWRVRTAEIRARTRRPLRRVRVPRDTALHGREEELNLLHAAYEQAKSGEGRVVLIEGEAGIGKSRLVHEFVDRLLPRGEEVHFLFGSYPPAGAATAASAFMTAYREHFGDSDLESALAPHLSRTPRLVPGFAALLRGGSIPADAEPLTKDSIQTAFVQVTRSLAAECPTIVLLDDLHFAPEEGRSLFAALSLAIAGDRVLLVGTARPGLPAAWLADLQRLGHAARMPLTRLGPRHLAALLVDALGSERLAGELGFQIGAKADGNPWFVFEILRKLREGGQLVRRFDGRWVRNAEIRDIHFPSTIVDLVKARLEDLDPMAKDLLDVAACCGFEFDPLLVGDVLGLGRIPVLQRLAAIEKTNRLVHSVGRRYVFDHHQIHEALYGGLSQPLREEYHALIGEALERRDAGAGARQGETAVRLCEHFLKGDRGSRALPYLLPALDHLEKGFENETAVMLADRALAAEGLLEGQARLEVLLRKARRLAVLGRAAQERSTLEEALRIADADATGSGRERARVRTNLGWILQRTGRHDEADHILAEAASLAAEARDPGLEAYALSCRGLALGSRGRPEEAKALYEQSLALAREAGDRRREGIALGNIGNLLQSLGRCEEAGAHHARALEAFREVGDRLNEVTATGNLGAFEYGVGLYERALKHFERHLELARELGFRRGEATALVNLGPLYAELGRPVAGTEALEAARALCREVAWPFAEASAVHALGAVAALSGDTTLAKERFREALGLRRTIGDRGATASTLVALGGLLVAEGTDGEARAHLAEALALAGGDSPGAAVLAGAWSALLPGSDATAAQRDFDRLRPRLLAHERLEAAFLLWKATRQPELLDEAGAVLASIIESAPESARAVMLQSVPLFRDVAVATGRPR